MTSEKCIFKLRCKRKTELCYESCDPEVYEFCSLVFGINTSPLIAQRVPQINAEVSKEEFFLASETIQRSTYMDDSIDSVQNEEKRKQL